MWDPCTSHFGPKKFDRVGRRGQGRSKYGTFGSFQWAMCTNALFWPSLTPPANLVKFFWSKMACTGVPHIVLHVSCGTRTSGGYFWPSEVRFRGILALSRDWFYNGKKQKCKFLKKGSLPDFQIFCGDSWSNFPKNGTNLRPGEFFLGFQPHKSLCIQWVTTFQ